MNSISGLDTGRPVQSDQSSRRDRHGSDLTVEFDRKMAMLAQTLSAVELKCVGIQSRAMQAEGEKASYQERLVIQGNIAARDSTPIAYPASYWLRIARYIEAEDRALQLGLQQEGQMEVESLLREEIRHLDERLEDERLQAAVNERRLQQLLSQERLRRVLLKSRGQGSCCIKNLPMD